MPPSPESPKDLARLLIANLAPAEQDLAEQGWDALCAAGFAPPEEQTTRSFGVPAEAWPYAMSILTFTGGIFAGAAKDALKGRLAGLFKKWLSGKDAGEGRLSETEIGQITLAIESDGARLGVPQVHRAQLRDDLQRLLRQSPAALILPG